MRILGIETSCDETSAAVYDSKLGLLSNIIYSQAETHAKFGGVVPEIASRDHLKKTIQTISSALKESNTDKKDLDGISYTAGPGLIGSLLVGASVAKSLAFALGIKCIPINHMEGHLLAAFLENNNDIKFPFVALLVSGGHTLLIKAEDIGKYTILGESVDDAAGEAFDKVGKLIGLQYPAGPHIEKLAESGNRKWFAFPRPMTDKKGLNFSFSGLKTSAVNLYSKIDKTDINIANMAASFQEAIIDTLIIKCKRALEETNINTLILAGGVSANNRLRYKINEVLQDKKYKIYFPAINLCTDNAAMIAYAGFKRILFSCSDNLEIVARAVWPIDIV